MIKLISVNLHDPSNEKFFPKFLQAYLQLSECLCIYMLNNTARSGTILQKALLGLCSVEQVPYKWKLPLSVKNSPNLISRLRNERASEIT